MTGRERKPQAPNVEYEVRQRTGWEDSGAPTGSLYGNGGFNTGREYIREPKKDGGDASPSIESENNSPSK